MAGVTTRRGTTPGKLLAGLRVLARYPSALRSGPRYLRSLVSRKSPLEMRIPWLTFDAIAWLERHVHRGSRVFEYGSGGSTLFLAARAGSLVSVEHDREWFEATRKALGEGAPNCEYLLREPVETADPPADYRSSNATEYPGLSFQAYIQAIDDYPDGHFDLVVVDGRARPACARRALPKVRPGGFLMLDDSDREHYTDVERDLSGWGRLDFKGPAPHKLDPAQTSVWRKPG